MAQHYTKSGALISITNDGCNHSSADGGSHIPGAGEEAATAGFFFFLSFLFVKVENRSAACKVLLQALKAQAALKV